MTFDMESIRSCSPFKDSIRIVEEKGHFFVKYACDTLGFHECECASRDEAEKVVVQLNSEASTLYSLLPIQERDELK